MNFCTSGDIHRMFLAQDKDTMITRNNVRRICRQSGIKHRVEGNIIFVDPDDFISKFNPYGITKHYYGIPRLRNIIGCAKEWDKHRGKGERAIHPDEIRAYLKTADNVFRYKFHNRWIVNYDQLEPYLKELSKTEMPYWVEIVKMKSAGRRGKKYKKIATF